MANNIYWLKCVSMYNIWCIWMYEFVAQVHEQTKKAVHPFFVWMIISIFPTWCRSSSEGDSFSKDKHAFPKNMKTQKNLKITDAYLYTFLSLHVYS